MIFTLILIIHVLACVILIGSVLIQQGKGASMGAAFGTAGSQTVFGSSGAGSFLTKVTSVCAAIFFTTSLILAYQSTFRRSVVSGGAPPPVHAPATPTPSAPSDAAPKGTADAANKAPVPLPVPTPVLPVAPRTPAPSK